MFSKKFLQEFAPEIEFLIGNAVVPAKALSYKKDNDGHIIDTTTPKTHAFEKKIRDSLKKELTSIRSFPTSKNVFVIIEHGFHSETDYQEHDLDNQAKTILDTLKEVVYFDDTQVKILWSYKVFLKNQSESYCRICIKRINKTQANRLMRKIRLLQK